MAGSTTHFTIDIKPGFDRMLSTLAQTKADFIRRVVASYTCSTEGAKLSITGRRDRVLKDVLLP